MAYDSTAKDSITLGGANGTKISNVMSGDVSSSSKDAVNGSQLFGVASSTAAGLGGGSVVNPDGTISAPTYHVQGEDTHDVGSALTTLDGGLNTLKDDIAKGGFGLVTQDPTSRDINVGAATDGTVVNFAGTAGNRKLTGVANGDVTTTSFDAINGSQLAAVSSSFATAIGGGSMMNSDGTISQPSFNVGGTTVNNVGDALYNLDGRVTQNTTDLTNLQTTVNQINAGANPDAVMYDSSAHDKVTLGSSGGTALLTNLTDASLSATSTDAVTGKQLFATNNDVAALQTAVTNISTTGNASIGVNGLNGADGTPGIPGPASANGSDAIAMGDNASASGDHTIVIGGGASGTGDGAVVIGGNASANGKDSIAIGNGATAPADNAVALGAHSVADRDNTVSVGSPGAERQITNVAAGTQGTDAVNLNQMNSAVGGIARKAYSGIAAATALTMIPDVDANKTLSIGIGGGTFQGYAATAIGGTARITQNIKVRVGAGWSAAGTTVGAGASYQW